MFLGLPAGACADELAALCADRTAIERVYYVHRLGEKPPFEQTLPPAAVASLVRQDLRKETALKRAYGLEVTPAMLEAEVQRINSTTRAPEILAELKTALGNEPARFALAVAKPIVVERLLRERFENDDKLHAGQRRQAELVRKQLLAAKPAALRDAPPAAVVSNLVALLKGAVGGQCTELTWQLAPPEKPAAPAPPGTAEIQQRFGPGAQLMAAPGPAGREQKLFFADLPPELQQVLQAQLRQRGDVSAVIETPGAFLLYVCKEKTVDTLATVLSSFPKRSYEQWLEESAGGQP